MKTLLKNGLVVNVFTDRIAPADVLIEDDRIIGVGTYDDADADRIEDISGRYVCPGLIDGHIHIESTMLQPAEFARICVMHGTTAVVADPHEIANVSGAAGMEYMLQASENLPIHIYYEVPSCVPATKFDEAGAVLAAEDIHALFDHPRVIGLGEMMNYPGVLFGDPDTMDKLRCARESGKLISGHAPMLSGSGLDRYISCGISDDHECTSLAEARERVEKGQWLMIRQGTAARNLEALADMFDEPWNRRCLLVTDDKHPADLMRSGHIDNMIRLAAARGKSAAAAVRMATIQPAIRFGLKDLGAIAPGYLADLLILDDLEAFSVRDVYYAGRKAVSGGQLLPFENPVVENEIREIVENSFNLEPLRESDFFIAPDERPCRVIEIVPGQLLTNCKIVRLDFDRENGVDIERDILKLAVIERHKNTGHIGLGYVSGLGLRRGAIASSVSHDSHNLIAAGTNERDMAVAANRIRELRGGLVVVCDGEVLSEMPLPIGGLMGTGSVRSIADQNERVRSAVHALGVAESIEPFMNLAFLSLPVIPSLKMTTRGLIDVDRQTLLSLFVD